MSANEYLIDASTRHQIMLQRLSGGSFNKLKPLLEKLQKDIRARLAENPTDFQMNRLTALMSDIQALFDAANSEVSKQLNLDLEEFIPYETDFQYRMLGNAVTTELTLPAIEQVVAAVTTAKAELISGGVTKRLTIAEMVETLGTKPATIENKIRSGVIEGKSVDQMVRDIMRVAYQAHKRDVRTVVRTAFNLASSQARQAVTNQNLDVISGEKWVSTLDGRTSFVCQGLDGKTFEVGVGRYPPAHMNCLPWNTNVSTCSAISNIYKRPYKGIIVNITTKSGRTISATPNHPILTTFGWVAIGEINLGDKLLCCNDVIETFKDNKQNIIAKIGEIFSAGYVSVNSSSIASAPSSAKDFHGDGSYSKVDVISVDGLANDKIKAAIVEKTENESLPLGSRVDFPLLPLRHLSDRLVTSDPSSVCGMGGRSDSGDLLWSGSRHSSELLLAPVSCFSSYGLNDSSYWDRAAINTEVLCNTVNSNTVIISRDDAGNVELGEVDDVSVNYINSASCEYSSDWRAATAEHLPDILTSNIINGVELDDVVDLFVSEFTETHVYNLENENNWYVANGIITHNCRSLRIPLVDQRYAIPGIKGKRSARDESGAVSQISSETTYNSWLKKQPAAFQDEVLGKERAKLFRGGMNVDKFTDDNGRTLTLSELKSLDSITL